MTIKYKNWSNNVTLFPDKFLYEVIIPHLKTFKVRDYAKSKM